VAQETKRPSLPDFGKRHRYRQPQTKQQVAAHQHPFRIIVPDRLKDKISTADIKYRPIRRHRLLRKFEDVPVKLPGAVKIVDKNAYRT